MTSQLDRDPLVGKSEKMAVIGEMTRGVAHEFNNLCQGIVGSMEVTRKLIAQGRGAESERFVDAAIASARRAATLTRRLLECARQVPPNPVRVEVCALLQSLEPLLRVSLPPATQLEFVLCGDGATVCCDANQLEIAILALVLDAVDANPDAAVIVVRVDDANQLFVCISVSHASQSECTGMADRPTLSLVERFTRGAGGDVILGESADGAGVTAMRLPRV